MERKFREEETKNNEETNHIKKEMAELELQKSQVTENALKLNLRVQGVESEVGFEWFNFNYVNYFYAKNLIKKINNNLTDKQWNMVLTFCFMHKKSTKIY